MEFQTVMDYLTHGAELRSNGEAVHRKVFLHLEEVDRQGLAFLARRCGESSADPAVLTGQHTHQSHCSRWSAYRDWLFLLADLFDAKGFQAAQDFRRGFVAQV